MTGPPFAHPVLPAPGLVYVADDGGDGKERRHYLKVQAADGTLQAFALDEMRALRLIADLLRVVSEIARAREKRS
jgi:hypothetical protein